MSIKPQKILKHTFIWLCTGVVSFLVLYPLYWIFISSITPPRHMFKKPIDLIPDVVTLDSYKFLFENVRLMDRIISTGVIIVSTLLISTLICTLCAYGFARYKSKGLTIAFGFILFSALIPSVVTARPLYDFMRSVNLFDTYPGLILLYVSSIIPFSMFILRNFIQDIPMSIEESAEIDGCNFTQKFFRITLPLMSSGIATICIINFIGCLSDFFTPLFYSNNIRVLSTTIAQLPLREDMYTVPWDLISAMGWIIMLPIIIFTVIFEKRIMSGIMAGGVKQ